jgi:hypothetical protein
MGINYKKKYLKYKKKYLEFKKLRGGSKQGLGRTASTGDVKRGPQPQSALNETTIKGLNKIVSNLQQTIAQSSGFNFLEIGSVKKNLNLDDVVKTIKNIEDFSNKINNLLETLETYLNEMKEKEKKAEMDDTNIGNTENDAENDAENDEGDAENDEQNNAEKVEGKVGKEVGKKRKRLENSAGEFEEEEEV